MDKSFKNRIAVKGLDLAVCTVEGPSESVENFIEGLKDLAKREDLDIEIEKVS
jgi:hypothetical protein